MRRVTLLLPILALTLLLPANAHAGDDEQGRPFAKGTVIPRVGVGFGWNDDLVSISWSGGAGYFVLDGLELGGTIGGTHLLWSEDIKRALPGIQSKLPSTLIEITPLVRYVFFRNKWFSPYAFAGVGPTFLTHNAAAPVIGHWKAGPGVYIGLGGPVFLDISVSFSSRFPYGTCDEAFTDVFTTAQGAREVTIGGMCGFRWSPGLGIGFSF